MGGSKVSSGTRSSVADDRFKKQKSQAASSVVETEKPKIVEEKKKAPRIPPKLVKPEGKQRPANAIFLKCDDDRIVDAQYAAYNNPDLEFLMDHNYPTSNGDPTTYTGYTNGKDKHGPGVIVYKSGNEYQGEFDTGLKQGTGQFTYKSNGAVHLGAWHKDIKNGYGVQKWKTGSSYAGMYKNNKMHGWAVYTMDNGDTDEGNWIDDKRNGVFTLVQSGQKKKYIYEDSRYVSEVYDESPEDNDMDWTKTHKPPHAFFLDIDNEFIKLAQLKAFTDPTLHFVEKLIMKTSSGDDTTYTGYVLRGGVKHGVGDITYISGNRYIGEFEGGLKSGFGQFHYGSNDSIYVGEWLGDLKNGYGEQRWVNGSHYKGAWKENKKDGHAWMIFDDGNTYLGPWTADKMNGVHIVTRKGVTETIEYAMHKFVKKIQ